ncbi:MAG: hypothetical protein ACRELA_12230 [Candidatus Rokuibacteriota bacterium]
MKEARGGNPRLSVGRAFVVHFRDDVNPAAKRVQGRVEHVVSGEAARFRSLEELLAFVGRRLRARASEPPPPGSQGPVARGPQPGRKPSVRGAGGAQPRSKGDDSLPP